MGIRVRSDGVITFFQLCHSIFIKCDSVFSKYVWVKPIKDKKEKEALNGFAEIVD